MSGRWARRAARRGDVGETGNETMVRRLLVRMLPSGPDPGPYVAGAHAAGPDPGDPQSRSRHEPPRIVAQPATQRAAQPAQAAQPTQAAGTAAREPQVPDLLARAAAWAWRLLLLGLLVYVAFRVAAALRLVVLPVTAALLLTALLQPLTARLRRAGLPAMAATWCTFLAAIIVLAALGMLAVNRVAADYPTLQNEVRHTAHQLQTSLAGSPFHLTDVRVDEYVNQFGHYLSQHKTLIEGTVVTGGKIVIEVVTGLVLMLFVTFFLIKDGRKIWGWLISALPPDARWRADAAGEAAWSALVNYMRGTMAVAAIHALVIGLALWLLGVPLLVPLVILVFIAAYVPLIGILVAGALAIAITLGTKGWIAAVILLGVFLVENQLEGHLLQPQVVGRIVKLHPLAIILVLAVGGIVAGVAGAIVAVPAAAAISYAWPHLRHDRPPDMDSPNDVR